MRCNWRRWLWGLIPLIAVSVAAVHLERGAIERDLAERAERALADKGARWAAVNVSGRDVVLAGSATAENEPPEAEAVLRNVWGVRQVKNNAGLPQKVEPFLWHATRRGDRVRLYGYVPNRATRQIIIGMTNATLPGLEVTDRMRTARGVPQVDTWLAGLSFALKQLAALKKGEVRLEDLALSVAGEAENAAEYRTVSAALKGGLPKGITLANVQIAAPVVSPYTWSAQFAGGQLVLSGHVADDGAKAELLAAAATAPAGTGVVDRLETARGAPADFAGAAALLTRQIVKLQSGNAEMKDTAVTVGGVAADEDQAKAVREALRTSMPAAFKLTDQIRVREPPKVDVKAEPKVGPKVGPKVEPTVEPKAGAEPTAPAPVEQRAAADAQPKADPQPAAAAPPARAEVPAKVEVQPEMKVVAQPPPAAEPQAAPAPPPSAPEPKEAAPPAAAAAPAEEPSAKIAAATPPPVLERAPEPASPPAAPPPAASPPMPAAGASSLAAPPAAPAAEAVAKAEPAPPSANSAAVCMDDLAKLAAANPIAFERGTAKVDAAGLATVGKIAAAMKACPGLRIVAEGHTDIEGSREYNQRLSIKRARAVAECLIKAGVAADLIETAGFGASRPAVPDTSAQARAKNRRTEIMVR